MNDINNIPKDIAGAVKYVAVCDKDMNVLIYSEVPSSPHPGDSLTITLPDIISSP